jgi:hypothetical protein
MNQKYISLLIAILLFGILLGIWIRPYFFGNGMDKDSQEPSSTRLTIDFGTPPADFGRRLNTTETNAANQAYDRYTNVLNNNRVMIGGDSVEMDSVFQNHELISIEALSELLFTGQDRTNPSNIINPAYVAIRPALIRTNSSTAPFVVKNHLFLLDAARNIIRDANGQTIIYDDMRRCPTWCNIGN